MWLEKNQETKGERGENISEQSEILSNFQFEPVALHKLEVRFL